MRLCMNKESCADLKSSIIDKYTSLSIIFSTTYNPGSIITKISWDRQQARELEIFIQSPASPPLASKLNDETKAANVLV